jgi:hypothetical protein
MGYSNMKYVNGTLEYCQQADAEISARCGWPDGVTTNWANPRELEDGSFAFEYPENGYEQFTKEQMLGDSNYIVIENPAFKVYGVGE